eukprot:GFUD01026566.1.p1 GENE.GFUD01026566.1~~GFUD01026566.1.p1  ORF type:complete len:239 (+),score=107.19 GFUD01026566.1:80-796(+)
MSGESKNPGAARFGNFINYYQFNPPENRLKFLPANLSSMLGVKTAPLTVLDVGCNAGNLTTALYQKLSEGEEEVKILGVDIDTLLIDRAKENNTAKDAITFLALDLMTDSSQVMDKLRSFLDDQNRTRFDLICVFSVTMWIHLNHGDQGLRTFISLLCRQARFLLLEPQPWKCYQTAARRMRKLGQQEFEKMKELEIRGPGVEEGILKICEEEGMVVDVEFGETQWNRKLLLLKHSGK